MNKEQIGVYKCWSCAKEVPVKKTATGKLSAPCGWCDFLHYASPGTKHFDRLLAATTLDAKPAPAPAPKAAPAPAPAAAPRKSSNPFGGA